MAVIRQTKENSMDNIPVTEAQLKKQGQGILNTAIAVITKPAEFFRGMAKSGGFGEPLVFLVVMGVIGGVIRALLGVFHLGMVGSTVMALASIVIVPIAVLIFGFIGAAILFVIWKVMGSNESYETAYRCTAFAAAISPITAVLDIIPFVGGLIGTAWMLFLLVNASVEVHKIAAKTAWMVFGIIAVILATMSTCSQLAARRMKKEMGNWEQQFGKPGQETTPEDMGKAAAAMMKAMQDEAARQAAEAKNQANE
jgi:hypothetical protein